MTSRLNIEPPAIVRSAESLASLAKKLKAYHARNREENRQHGLLLLDAQELCLREGKGWEAWLENETGIPQTTARRWMTLAKNQGHEEEEKDQLGHAGPADSLNDHMSVPVVFHPGWIYFCQGTDANGAEALADVARLPDRPEYCVFSFLWENGDLDSCGRGMRIDGAEDFQEVAAAAGFFPRPDGWRGVPFGPKWAPLAWR